jgi:ribose-phosphate pyrophosphokinase
MLKLNGVKIDVTMFPDNTSQVWQVPEAAFEGRAFNIVWDFDHEGEIMHLVQLVELIRHGRVPKPVNLHMPYLPYGRQDKEISNDATFALKSLCRILGDLYLTKITTLDAHSKKANNYLHNFENIHPSLQLAKAIELGLDEDDDPDNNALAFPDDGACVRYAPHFKHLKEESIITGDKVRNQTTGYIEKYDFEGNPEGKNVLIIDDICDGGMTFIILAKSLLEAGSKSVNLYVTHGIFSKGLKPLKEAGIGRIFTSKGEAFNHKTGAGDVVVYGNPRPPKGMLDSETSNM